MDFISLKLFLLGALVFIIPMYLSILIWYVLSIIFKLSINDVSIFYFPSYSVKIFKTNFSLGWLPLGTYVGYSPTTFSKANQSIKLLAIFTPFLANLFGFSLVLIIMNQPIEDIFKYIQNLIGLIFSDSEYKTKFGLLTVSMISKTNIVVFSYFIIQIILAILNFFQNLDSYLENIKSNQKFLKYIILAISLFIIYKVISVVLFYFTLQTIMIYILNILIAFIITGIILYFLTIMSLKLIEKK